MALHKGGNRFRSRCRHRMTRPAGAAGAVYHVTDLLHDGHAVDVPDHDIATTLSAWLAELGPLPHWSKTLHERYAPATGPPPTPSVIAYPLTSLWWHEHNKSAPAKTTVVLHRSGSRDIPQVPAP